MESLLQTVCSSEMLFLSLLSGLKSPVGFEGQEFILSSISWLLFLRNNKVSFVLQSSEFQALVTESLNLQSDLHGETVWERERENASTHCLLPPSLLLSCYSMLHSVLLLPSSNWTQVSKATRGETERKEDREWRRGDDIRLCRGSRGWFLIGWSDRCCRRRWTDVVYSSLFYSLCAASYFLSCD